MPALKLLPHLLRLSATLLVLRVAYAIHDPAYTGIKTKTYQRDPIIAAAFEQQQQPQHQYSPNYQAANERNTYSQPTQGDYYHQQELPLYERSRYTQHGRHAAYQGANSWNDAENAITEYYAGCPAHYTGQLAYAYDCRRFVNCWNGRGHIQSCAPGTVFNAETLECDRPDKVVCGTLSALGAQDQQPRPARYRAGHSLDIATENVANLCPPGVNGMQPHPTDCTKFLNCANGNVHVQNCGPGTAYSKTLMTCDFKHKVDCSGRESGADAAYNNNRDSKSYTHGGSSGSQNNNQWGSHESGSRDDSWTTTTQQSTGHNNRWSNMNRPRPDANLYGRQDPNAWENQHQASESEYADTQRNTETESSWSGHGSSINRQTPSHSVTFESGSLQPNRNYDHSIKNYRAPLAPFSPNAFNAATTTTTTTRTPNIYYAQPVGSQEDSDETFSNISGGDLAPNFSQTPTTNRQNHSREIPFNHSNNWRPVYNRPSQSPNVHVLPNPNLLTPHRETNSYPHSNVPEPHLRPPFFPDVGQRPLDEDLPGEQADLRQHTINIDNLPGNSVFQMHPHSQPDDQLPSGSHRINNLPVDASNLYGGLQPPQSNYPNHRPSYSQPAYNPLDFQSPASNYPYHRPSYAQPNTNPTGESNLYGGLRPPPLSTPLQETTTARNYLHTPTFPTTPLNTYQTPQQNVRVQQIYPLLTNASESRAPFDPHYSPPYASVAHSRNTSWPAFDRKGGRNPVSNPVEQPENIFSTTTERHGVSPPAYNRQFYAPPTNALKSNSEAVADDNAQLPISDALRMLLQPYFNRSGTVSEDAAAHAEEHIMKLVSAQTTSTTSTTQHTSSTPSYPSTTPGDDDVELILAGEQHHMITVPTQIGTHEVSTEFHENQQTTQKHEENTNWHKHEHSRDYHLRHPELQSPFKEDERSSIIPNYNPNNHHYHHNHHRHDSNYHHEHSPEFHHKHPNLPNPFEKSQAEPDDSYDVYRPNAESTTSHSYDIDLRGSSDSGTENCQFSCGNSKCVKTFEVCDGVDNCGNRKDEEQCSHLGYEVRLTGGDNTNMGRVEVKILGKWGYVCDDKFGLRDADVVCRELGFNLGASEVRGNSFYPPTELNFSFMMDEVDCRGNETALKECKFKGWGVNNCGPDEIVGVVCKVPLLKCPNNYWLCSTSKECIPPAFVCDNTPDCADQSDESERVCNSTVEYRLEGGRSANEGRLEVKYRSVWGTVCDDDFSLKEAQVVCNSLGFYGKPTIEKNIFGPGSGPIWLDQVSCYGNETTLDKCNHWTWGEHNCNHTEDVGLRCTAGPPPRRAGVNSVNIYGNDGQHTEEDTQSALEDLGLYPGQWERSSKAINPQRRCGHFKQDLTDEYEHPEERVVNGTVAKRGRHPWQATIRTRGRGGISSHWCGAVLISKKHLLTAAHCLAGYPKGAYFVRMGDHYANIAESSEVDGYIENWYIHEKFRDQTHMNNDIALIVLKHPVRFNDYVQPICLPEKGAALAENRMCTISGWGSIKSGVSTPSNILRAAQLPILADATCKQSHVYGASLTEGMFCAGYMDESVDACDGDSGGPLICSDDDGETLYGIISWGQHCGYANKPGVYVRVEKYIDWIYEKINFAIQQSAARP